MANEEHVKILKQGVTEWNAWREGPRDLLPDGTPLPLDLIAADLQRALLSGANLSHAHLIGADLRDANLSHANLSHAYLHEADLRDVNLSHANLSHARLADANLSHAILLDTNLSDALLGATLFGNAYLIRVIGLETCVHLAPSIIDHKTLRNSGRLPLQFLRGVGLPDNFIEYLPSLLNQVIQYYSCFISYSTKDQEFADRIHADLQNCGARCWYSPHDMPIGGKILDELDTAIRLREKVLLILSEHSIKSDWVEEEVTRALEEERKRKTLVLFPVKLDDAVMETGEAWARGLRIQRHIGDFRDWKEFDRYKKSFERVLRDLKRAAE